ncbi:MAG: hypothetical protein K1000chlam2_01352 [Chlamydiae bacterium]|nr:hypothetical protein [Chlamydiota bacterium]
MKSELKSLIADTIAYLKDEGLISQQPSSPAPQKITPPKPKPIAEEKLNPTPVAIPKKESPLLFEKIQKHLPHMRLMETIPAMQQVAIVIPQDEEMTFFQNLAKAIEERLCPVKWINEEGVSEEFVLILSQTPLPSLPQDKQILLEKVSVYQNNTEKKKQLWLQICQSLKSS